MFEFLEKKEGIQYLDATWNALEALQKKGLKLNIETITPLVTASASLVEFQNENEVFKILQKELRFCSFFIKEASEDSIVELSNLLSRLLFNPPMQRKLIPIAKSWVEAYIAAYENAELENSSRSALYVERGFLLLAQLSGRNLLELDLDTLELVVKLCDMNLKHPYHTQAFQTHIEHFLIVYINKTLSNEAIQQMNRKKSKWMYETFLNTIVRFMEYNMENSDETLMLEILYIRLSGKALAQKEPFTNAFEWIIQQMTMLPPQHFSKISSRVIGVLEVIIMTENYQFSARKIRAFDQLFAYSLQHLEEEAGKIRGIFMRALKQGGQEDLLIHSTQLRDARENVSRMFKKCDTITGIIHASVIVLTVLGISLKIINEWYNSPELTNPL